MDYSLKVMPRKDRFYLCHYFFTTEQISKSIAKPRFLTVGFTNGVQEPKLTGRDSQNPLQSSFSLKFKKFRPIQSLMSS